MPIIFTDELTRKVAKTKQDGGRTTTIASLERSFLIFKSVKSELSIKIEEKYKFKKGLK